MTNQEVQVIIEAALFASTEPLSVERLLQLFCGKQTSNIKRDDVIRAIEQLQTATKQRGLELVKVASGYRYQVRQSMYPWIQALWTEKPARYSRALLETLALIAYKQPLTRGDIEQIRGVAVSSHMIKTLEQRAWIKVVGHRDTPGRPALYATTRHFLDYFNLSTLDELPPLVDLANATEVKTHDAEPT